MNYERVSDSVDLTGEVQSLLSSFIGYISMTMTNAQIDVGICGTAL